VSSYYWSSTTHAYNTDYAWLVHFYYGSGNVYGDTSDSYYVHAVRGGQCGVLGNLPFPWPMILPAINAKK